MFLIFFSFAITLWKLIPKTETYSHILRPAYDFIIGMKLLCRILLRRFKSLFVDFKLGVALLAVCWLTDCQKMLT